MAYNLEKYLLDGVRDKLDLEETWVAIREMVLKWQVFLDYYGQNKYNITLFYEKFGAQRDIEVLKTLQERDGVFFDIHEMSGKAKKEERIARLIPDLKRGNFKIPKYIHKHGQICRWVNIESEGRVKMTFENEDEIDPKTRKNRFEGINEFSRGFFDWEIQQRKCYPLIKHNFEGLMYDYTKEFIEEYQDFPFGKNDDILDSISRLYDVPDLYMLIAETKIHEY